jgi:surface protein
MATTSDYLKQLNEDKKALVDNLNSLGVQADYSQTFTSLVPKISDSGLAKPTGTIELKTNGIHNVAPYETAKVEFEVKLEEQSASAVVSGDLVVEPSEGYDGLSKVVINKVTANIDPQIKEENIREGVNILGVEGTFKGSPILQEKEVVPNEETQNVIPDDGYNGLSRVIVEPIPSDYINPTGTLSIDENGAYEVKKYANVVVDVQSSGGTEETYFATLNKTGTSSSPGVWQTIMDVPSNTTITVGQYQFSGCKALVKVPKLNYENLTNCQYMFKGCSAMKDTTNAKNFKKITNSKYMFSATGFEEIDMSTWNVSNVTTMASMFNDCTYTLKKVNISNWVNSKNTSLASMFWQCKRLTTLIAENTKISGTCQCNSMFEYCTDLVELDLSWLYRTGNNTINLMFGGCSKLQKLDIRNFDLSSVTTSSYYTDAFKSVPTTCEIIVMNDACKTWMSEKFPTMTNVKTVAELGE